MDAQAVAEQAAGMNIDFRSVCLLMEMQGGQTEVEISSRKALGSWDGWGSETMFVVQHDSGWYLFAGWNGNGWNRYYVIDSITDIVGGILFVMVDGLHMQVRRPYQRVFKDQVMPW
jgi:hypothetical protein